MSTPSRFKKDKEIIAEYESQVKGKQRESRRGGRASCRPLPRLPAEPPPPAGRPVPVARTSGREGAAGGRRRFPPSAPSGAGGSEGRGPEPDGSCGGSNTARPRPSTFPSSTDFGNARGAGEGKGKGGQKKKKARQLLRRETMLSHTSFLRHMAAVSHPPLRAVVSVLGCRRWLIKNYPWLLNEPIQPSQEVFQPRIARLYRIQLLCQGQRWQILAWSTGASRPSSFLAWCFPSASVLRGTEIGKVATRQWGVGLLVRILLGAVGENTA